MTTTTDTTDTSLRQLTFTTPQGEWTGSFYFDTTELPPSDRYQERDRVPAGRLDGRVTVNGVGFEITFYVEYSDYGVWNPSGGEDGGGAYQSVGTRWHMKRTGYINTRRTDGGHGDVSYNARNKAIDAALVALNDKGLDLDARIAATHGAIEGYEIDVKGLRKQVEKLQDDIDAAISRWRKMEAALDTLQLTRAARQ